VGSIVAAQRWLCVAVSKGRGAAWPDLQPRTSGILLALAPNGWRQLHIFEATRHWRYLAGVHQNDVPLERDRDNAKIALFEAR